MMPSRVSLLTNIALAALAGCSNSGATVTRADFENAGKTWPLIVDEAQIGCDGVAKWVEVHGVRYGINGLAKQRGLPGMDPVWRVDEEADRILRSMGDKKAFRPRVSDFDLNKAAGRYCSKN